MVVLRTLPIVQFNLFHNSHVLPHNLHSFPTRRSSDLERPHLIQYIICAKDSKSISIPADIPSYELNRDIFKDLRSEEHTSELQSRGHLVCRLLLEKKKIKSK